MARIKVSNQHFTGGSSGRRKGNGRSGNTGEIEVEGEEEEEEETTDEFLSEVEL